MVGGPSDSPGAGSGAPPERRCLGDGEVLVRLAGGRDGAFRVDAPHDKPGWRPRRAATGTLGELAGTAVALDGELYEVTRAEPAARGTGWSYWLRPWDEQEPVRGLVSYGAEEVAREAAARVARQRRQGASALLVVAAPVVGLLPAADQRRLEVDFGFPAARATLLGAVLALGTAFAVLVLGLAQNVSPQPDAKFAWAADAVPAALYFAVESWVRLWSALQLGEPMGSLPVWLPVSVLRALRAPARVADARERRARREMWVETLEPFLGLLDESTQEQLARSFPQLDAHRGTRASILGAGAFAAVSLLVAALHLATEPRLGDVLVLVVAGALGIEAWSRHLGWRRGQIRGSVIGLVLRPLARRLLT